MAWTNRHLCIYSLAAASAVQVVVLFVYIQLQVNPALQKVLSSSAPTVSSQLHSKIINRGIMTNETSSNALAYNTNLASQSLRGFIKPETKPLIVENFTLHQDSTKYFFNISNNISCMKFGSDDHRSQFSCTCKAGWYGKHCSIPENVQSSSSYDQIHNQTKVTYVPRRVINGFTFNREWNMLEARMHEIGTIVDVFIILESNYTLHGDPKELWLLERLKKGYLKEFQHKILYVVLDHFPKGGREDGWLAERYYRNYIFTHGIQGIKGTLPSDLFMFTDADELPSFESILFLKLHQGYPEPVGFIMYKSAFGFFWTLKKPQQITSVCTLRFLKETANNKVQDLRAQRYIKKADTWYIGSETAKAGWHCSWCFPAEDVRNKLVSAINADFPRWGDYPSKLKLPYIRKLIKTGTWFNDQRMDIRNVTYHSDPSIVPSYILKNAHRYRHILDLDYAGSDLHKVNSTLTDLVLD